MGSDKLRLPLGSMSLGNIALETALSSELDYVVIVSNDVKADWIDSTFYHEPFSQKWSVFHCSEAYLGLAHSLRLGVKAALAMGAAAIMILLADQPLITKEMIHELINHYQTNNTVSFVSSRYDGLARPPIIFDKRMFPDLLRLQNDQGARQLIRRDSSGLCIDFTNPELFMDIDTSENYKNLLELWKS